MSVRKPQTYYNTYQGDATSINLGGLRRYVNSDDESEYEDDKMGIIDTTNKRCKCNVCTDKRSFEIKSDNDNEKSTQLVSQQFVDCCMSGKLSESIEFYDKNKDMIVSDEDFNQILMKCCKNGMIDIASWICDIHDFRYCNNIFLKEACKNGNLELLKFFYSIGFDIHQDHDELMRLACEYGNILIAQWLYKMNAVIYYGCLRKACANNNLDIVNWIVDLYNTQTSFRNRFNANDIGIDVTLYNREQYAISELLIDTCTRSHFEIAMLLYDTWKDHICIRYKDDLLFKIVCKNRFNSFAAIIYDIGFDSTSTSKKKRNHDTLLHICKHGDIDDVKWFFDFCESMGDPIKMNESMNDCFVQASLMRSYKIAKWIFNLDPSYRLFIIDLLKNGKTDILSFLDLSHSTVYLLLQCTRTYGDVFNIDLVDEVDEFAARILLYFNKTDILVKLKNKFDSVTLETDDNGVIFDCRIDKNIIKNARKI